MLIFKANRHTLFIWKINTAWAPWSISGHCFLVKSEISVMKIYQIILDIWVLVWIFWSPSVGISLLDSSIVVLCLGPAPDLVFDAPLGWSPCWMQKDWRDRKVNPLCKNHGQRKTLERIILVQQPNGITATRLLKLRNQSVWVRGYSS